MAQRSLDHFARLLVAFADQSGDSHDFIIPESLDALSDEDLAELHATAVGHFDSLYGDGKNLAPADVDALGVLTEGIESLLSELTTRQSAADERAAAAAELATRVHHEERTETIEDVDDDAEEETPEEDTIPEPVAVAASGRKEIRVNLSSLRSRQNAQLPPPATDRKKTIKDVLLASGEGTGFPANAGLDWNDVGRIVDRRLGNYNAASYEQAARAGRELRQQFSVAQIRREMDPDLTIGSGDSSHVESVLQRAKNEHRLPGGSLVASGGWCAPSEILYDLAELESNDGLVSLPEIGISRGGIQVTPGPTFATIYAGSGFVYTEAYDIAGTYAVSGADNVGSGSGGSKPCYTVPCPSFTDYRLHTAGVCISAGLLQQRGYPEVIARTVRGAVVAHNHRVSGQVVAAMVTGSTAVTMTAATIGTTAPLLKAIELQVEHYRYVNRLSRNTTLEAVFPFWVRGAIRSDLALRTGVDMLAVTDAQIADWFALRGIAAQYVYDWQPITGAAGSFVTWPANVIFLLYAAGTWVKGVSDVISIDTLYDSTLLGANNYTALFTEEGWLVAPTFGDSRAVTVPVCGTGGTGGPVTLTCTGVAAAGTDVTQPVPGSCEPGPTPGRVPPPRKGGETWEAHLGALSKEHRAYPQVSGFCQHSLFVRPARTAGNPVCHGRLRPATGLSGSVTGSAPPSRSPRAGRGSSVSRSPSARKQRRRSWPRRRPPRSRPRLSRCRRSGRMMCG